MKEKRRQQIFLLLNSILLYMSILCLISTVKSSSLHGSYGAEIGALACVLLFGAVEAYLILKRLYNPNRHRARENIQSTAEAMDCESVPSGGRRADTGRDYCWIAVAALFVLSVCVRFYIADFVKSIQIYPDELRYFAIAEGIATGRGISINNTPSNFQHILFSLILQPAFLADGKLAQISLIALISCIVMSSGIFPAYLISKEFVRSKAYRVILCALYVLIPDMTVTMTFMSEAAFLPLGLWTLYVFFRLFRGDCQGRKRNVLRAVLGVLVFLSVLCKIMALTMLVAYAVYLPVYAILSEKGTPEEKTAVIRETKRGLTDLFVIASIFIVLYFLYQTVFFGGAFSQYFGEYSGENKIDILSEGHMRYILYAAVYLLCCGVLAIGFLPAVFPALYYGKLSKQARRTYIFLICISVVLAGIIAVMASLRENFPSPTPRVNLRFYIHLTIPFVCVFLHLCENMKGAVSDKGLGRPAIVGVTGLFLAIFFPGVAGAAPIDQTMLDYMLRWSNNKVFLFCCVVGVLAILAVLAFRVNSRIVLNSFLIVMLVVQPLNNQIAIGLNYAEHDISGLPCYKDVDQVAAFIEENQDKVFLLAGDGLTLTQRVADTYLNYPNVYMTYIGKLIGMQNEMGIDLTQQRIPAVLYGEFNLGHIDFLLTTIGADVALTQGRKVTAPEFESAVYDLYELDHATQLPRLWDWWSFQDGIVDTPVTERFYSKYPRGKEGFVSQEQDDFLLYGPYKTLPAGTYTVTFQCRYIGQEAQGSPAGWVDVYGDNMDLSSYIKGFTVGEQEITIDGIQIPEDCQGFQMRMYTSAAGVVIDRVRIERLD